MATKIKIRAGKITLAATLNDSSNASAIVETLPIEGKANRWGDEIYFRMNIDHEEESDARAEMEVGELAYWPPGKAFCIFWGPTPASTNTEPMAASNVNPIGRIDGDATVLSAVEDGEIVYVERAG